MSASPAIPNLPILPNLGGSPSAAQPYGTLPINPTASTTIGAPTTGISAGLNTADGSHTVTGDFKDTYGAGVGTALAGVLGNLGTATDSAVTATNQQILDAAGRQEANIRAGNAAHGLSADSSASALALGDFAAQTNQTIATTDSQMELSQEDELIKALMTEGEQHGGDVSGWDTFANVLKGVGSTIGDVAGAFVGDPLLGNQISNLLPSKSVSTPDGGGLFQGDNSVNELDDLASL